MRIAPFPRPLALIFLGLLATLAGPLAAKAQVLVYKLQFETTGKTLNYDFYDGGYFVCTAPKGEGTFILTVRAVNNTLYYTTADGGNLFYIEDRGKRLAVLTASGGTTGATSTYQATGDIDGARSIGGSISMPYARDLDGYLLASQETGDPVIDDPNDPNDLSDGFAGYSKIKARIDTGKTKDYNEDDLTVAEAVTEVTTYLKNRHYVAEPAPATGASTTTTP